MFCQGTGLVPFVPVLEDLLEDEDDEVTVKLIYSCAKLEEILLLDKLNEFCGFWNFNLKIFLGSGEEMTGRIPQRTIVRRKLCTKDIEKEVVRDKMSTRYLVCGSKLYMQNIQTTLAVTGVDEENMYRF